MNSKKIVRWSLNLCIALSLCTPYAKATSHLIEVPALLLCIVGGSYFGTNALTYLANGSLADNEYIKKQIDKGYFTTTSPAGMRAALIGNGALFSAPLSALFFYAAWQTFKSTTRQ